jgi:hypothetical protein
VQICNPARGSARLACLVGLPLLLTLSMQRIESSTISLAECMARTGLTARALRIYERNGLLTPLRSSAGRRHYRAQDLTRLNTITMLKSAASPCARSAAR